jgi:hypothetical protein
VCGRYGPCATEGVGEIFEEGDRPARIEFASGKAGNLPAPVLREIVRLVCSPSRGLTCTCKNGASLSESFGPICSPAPTARFREASPRFADALCRRLEPALPFAAALRRPLFDVVGVCDFSLVMLTP